MTDIVISVLFLLFGFALLAVGANYLVKGSSSIALRFHIRPIVIGLTVVSFGTATPDFLASILSAYRGNTDMALGIIIGTNIFNILVILGISAIVFPLQLRKNTVWKEIPLSFLAAIVLVILGFQNILDQGNLMQLNYASQQPIGSLTFSNGLLLLSFFVVFVYYVFGLASVKAEGKPDVKQMSMLKSILWILLSIVALGIGSNLSVANAENIAQAIGISNTLISLTILAGGTSLPELVTSVVAAKKKDADLAVGNVVGSNIFNIFLILGIVTLITPVPVTAWQLLDILFLLLVTAYLFVTGFILMKYKISRAEGIIMLMLYATFIGVIILRE